MLSKVYKEGKIGGRRAPCQRGAVTAAPLAAKKRWRDCSATGRWESVSRSRGWRVASGLLPWLEVQNGKFTETSKQNADEIFPELGGRVFFASVEPMRTRSKATRRGWGELVSELVSFARKAKDLVALWRGVDHPVQAVASEIRKISGFGGKGFRMKDWEASLGVNQKAV